MKSTQGTTEPTVALRMQTKAIESALEQRKKTSNLDMETIVMVA